MRRRSFRKPVTKTKTPRVRVAVALINEQGLLLVRHQKRERSYWLLPGGGLEFGERDLSRARCDFELAAYLGGIEPQQRLVGHHLLALGYQQLADHAARWHA